MADTHLGKWMNAVWIKVFGFPARAADIAVVQRLSEDNFESRADAIINLLWNHGMGEPEEPTVDQVRAFVVAVGQEMGQETQ